MKLGILDLNGVLQELNKGYLPIVGDGRDALKVILSGDFTADYIDISDDVSNWSKYGIYVVGKFTGFREYRSIRREIYTRIELICGVDYMDWDLLSSEQKQIALEWCNIRIINSRGIDFYVTECGSQEQSDSFVDLYFKKSKEAAEFRYLTAYTKFFFDYLGKSHGIKAESYARKDFLDTTYMIRGTVYSANDGIDGIGDWVLGQSSYETTGLKPKIIAEEFTLSDGMDTTTFCDTLVGILNDGLF